MKLFTVISFVLLHESKSCCVEVYMHASTVFVTM